MSRPRAADRPVRDCFHRVRHPHGTLHGYNEDGCRCDPCTDAYSAYDSGRRRAIAYGRWDTGMVDAQPVLEHVIALREAGWTKRDIYEGAGVSRAVVQRLLYEPYRSKRVRRENAEKLLSLQPEVVAGLDEALVQLCVRGLLPQTGPERLGNDERLEVVRRLHRSGLSDLAIEARTGISARQVIRDRRRQGLVANFEQRRRSEDVG